VLEEEYDGFKFRVLFNKYGYTPHYAEHFVEDDSEKLLMADPHMRRSAFIYNVDEDRIEWEYAVNIPAKETRRLEFNTRGRSFLRLFFKRSERKKPAKVNVVVPYN
jgi:hypothetical protein